MSKNGYKLSFYLSKIFIGLFFVLITGILVFYFLYYKSNKDITMIDIMSYLTGSVAILTLIYYSLSLESTYNFHEENIRIRKHQYSYEIISKFTDPEMAKQFKILNEIKLNNKEELKEKNIKDFLKFLENNPKKRMKLVLLLNYFEHISLLVNNKHVEEEIIKSSFKTLFTSTYSMLKFYIDERQLEHRRSWIKFEEIATRWSKEK